MSRSQPVHPVISSTSRKASASTNSKIPSQRRMRLYLRTSGESAGGSVLMAAIALDYCITAAENGSADVNPGGTPVAPNPLLWRHGRPCPCLASRLHRMHESFSRCQHFLNQFRRRSLGVDTQQRLCARSAEQHPRLCSVAVARCIEEELDAIESFFP